MKVWKKGWEDKITVHPIWINMLLLWITIPISCELVGRALNVDYMGLFIGFIIALIKTWYDYMRIMYF